MEIFESPACFFDPAGNSMKLSIFAAEFFLIPAENCFEKIQVKSQDLPGLPAHCNFQVLQKQKLLKYQTAENDVWFLLNPDRRKLKFAVVKFPRRLIKQ